SAYLLLVQGSIDGRPADTQAARDLGWPDAVGLKLPYLRSIDRWRPSLVGARRLGPRDPFHLPLTAEGCLELGEDAQHVEERFCGRRGRVDWLLSGLELSALRADLLYDALEVSDRAGKAIDPCNDQRVTLAEDVQRELQLRSVRGRGPTRLF